MKALTIKTTATKSESIQEVLLKSRTFTNDKVNITAINTLQLIVAANSFDKRDIKRVVNNETDKNNKRYTLTVSASKVAEYFTTVLKFYKCYHKKDAKSLHAMLESKNSFDFATNNDLRAIASRVNCTRLIEHSYHHLNVLKDFDDILINVDKDKKLITFKLSFVQAVQLDKDNINDHVSALKIKAEKQYQKQ